MKQSAITQTVETTTVIVMNAHQDVSILKSITEFVSPSAKPTIVLVMEPTVNPW